MQTQTHQKYVSLSTELIERLERQRARLGCATFSELARRALSEWVASVEESRAVAIEGST